MRYLIELGADLTAKDSSEYGLIQIAALQHCVDMLKYLVDIGQPVFQELSAMLTADTNSGYPKAAARSLDPLTQWRPECCSELLKHGVIPSLVKLLGAKGDEKLPHLAIQVLSNISTTEDIKSALVTAKAIPHLVPLLSSASDRVQACTCIVLCDLGIFLDNQTTIVKAGATPHLVKLLASEADDVQLYACACLGILAYDNSSNQSSIASDLAMPAIKPLLSSDLSCIQACAANTIQSLVESNRICQLGSLSHSLLPPLVLLLRSKETSVYINAAFAIEALAEDCQEVQQELLGNFTCISLLKRLLRMSDPQVKVAGGRALWAIAGHLISNKRTIASHMGLNLLVSMLTIHNEKLDFVCSEALGSLATELGSNQNKIHDAGGVKPLIEVLTIPTSQRVYLSVIDTLAKIVTKPSLMPNKELQKAVAKCRGLIVLSSVVCSEQTTQIVRVNAACTLAHLVLDNPENTEILATNTDFSFMKVLEFFSSSDSIVRIKAGQCLALLVFKNPSQLATLQQHSTISVNFYTPYLESGDEYLQCYAGFQLVVLSKLLTGIYDAEAAVRGVQVLTNLLTSLSESTQVTSTEFIASLAHSAIGIPEIIVMTGALDRVLENLMSGSVPVVENCCIALGHLSFVPMAARVMMGTFRDQPEKLEVFRENCSAISVSKKFLSGWQYTEEAGLPVLRYIPTNFETLH